MKIVKLQKITLTFGGSDTSKDGSLSGFSDVSKIVPFGLSSRLDSDSQIMSDSKFDCEIVDSSTVRVTRGGSGAAGTVIVYVVEFDSNTSVQSGSFTLTSSTSVDNTINSVTTSESFVIGWWKSTETSTPNPEEMNLGFELESSTNVRVHLDTSGKDHSGHYYVISNPSLSVQRGTFAKDATPAETTISSVDLAKSYLIWSDTTDENQYEDEGNAEGHLKDSTTIQFNPGYSSGSHTYYWQVISDTELVNVQRFNTRNTGDSSGDYTLTTVDLNLTLANAGHPIASNSSSEYNKAYDMSCRSTTYDINSTTNVHWVKDSNNGSAVVEIISFAQAETNPVITDADDENFNLHETDITLSGNTFGDTQGSGKLEISNNSTYGDGTLVSQSIDSWSDTSIQFDLELGSITENSLYLYVTNDNGKTSDAYAVTINRTPNITDADDEVFEVNETNIPLSGINFDTTQGSGKLEISNNSTYGDGTLVSQSIDSWSDTSIQFDLELGSLTEIDLFLFVTNDDGYTSSSYSVRIARVPNITDADDEVFEVNETNIPLSGTSFYKTQSSGKLEISNNSTYGDGTLVEQTIDSWSDTSIQFDLELGSLDETNLFLFVTNDVQKTSSSYSVKISRTPTITNIEDENFDPRETDIVLDGTYLGDTQGSGKLEISNNSTYGDGTLVEQTIDSWSDTSIQFDLELGTLTETTLYVFVTNDFGKTSTSKEITINGPTISSIEDGKFSTTETDVVIDGSVFYDTQGDGKVELGSKADYSGINELQTINSWSDTSINIDINMGSLQPGTLYMFVTNDDGLRSEGFSVELKQYAVDTGIYKTQSIVGVINSKGFFTTVYLISDE